MTGEIDHSMKNISQDSFNKLVTTYLILFFSVMYVLSWLTHIALDWQPLLTFVVPMSGHVVHNLVNKEGNNNV